VKLGESKIGFLMRRWHIDIEVWIEFGDGCLKPEARTLAKMQAPTVLRKLFFPDHGGRASYWRQVSVGVR
jgi:hypothetical protein